MICIIMTTLFSVTCFLVGIAYANHQFQKQLDLLEDE